MERNISPAAILCIVLVSLAAVIGLGYGAFAITKGSANEGNQELASQTSYASNSWKDDYDAKDVTGAQVQTLLNEADNKGIAVFINTRGMCQGTITSASEVPVLKHNGKYYMNYGTVFDYEDDSYKKVSGEVSMSGNSNLLGVRDGSSLRVDANPKLDNGQIVKNKDYTGLYTNGAVNYIDVHAKYRSNLIYGNNGEVVGVILSQSSRAGASLPLSSGGGFVNGSGAMGGTSGSYIPSHSGGGNIPLTGGGSFGGSSSSGGSKPSSSLTNYAGASTTPSTPAPAPSSDEIIVTFDTLGGSVVDYQKVTTGFKVTKPVTPSRVGYGFAGWYTDKGYTSKYNFDAAVSKSITLYACWFKWGDINLDGSIDVSDSLNILQCEEHLIGEPPLYLAGFVNSLSEEENELTKAESDTVLQYGAGLIRQFPVELATSHYEFDFENGCYYTDTGVAKKIPVYSGFWALNEYTWKAISTITCLGYAPSAWKIGDTTTVSLNEKDYIVAIAGFNQDGDKTLTFTFKESVGKSTHTSLSTWATTKVRTTFLPGILEKMSNKEYIIEVEKKTIKGYAAGANKYDIETTRDKLFLPSFYDMSGLSNYSGEGPRYEYFKTKSNRIAGNAFYWLRSPAASYNGYNGVDKTGVGDGNGYYCSCNVVPMFVVGKEQRSSGNTDETRTKIPTGGTYYVNCGYDKNLGDYSAATAVYDAGDYFPLTLTTGDVYVYNDYEYRYNMVFDYDYWLADDSLNGWGVKYLANDSKPDAILNSINGKNIVAMCSTFIYMDSLEISPEIPNSVQYMWNTFDGCSSLKVAPVLPDALYDMADTFQGCTSLINPPVIPNGVVKMTYSFNDCSSLKSAPLIPEGVVDMCGTFSGCSSLDTAPVIPSSVQRISGLFIDCKVLTGEVVINAIPLSITTCDNVFRGTEKSIVLSGSCPYLIDIAATANNVTVAN